MGASELDGLLNVKRSFEEHKALYTSRPERTHDQLSKLPVLWARMRQVLWLDGEGGDETTFHVRSSVLRDLGVTTSAVRKVRKGPSWAVQCFARPSSAGGAPLRGPA
jgi:hypothetical protein